MKSGNPRRKVVEDQALTLAERLISDGISASGLGFARPFLRRFANCGEHVPLLRAALLAVAGLSEYTDYSRKVFDAIDADSP